MAGRRIGQSSCFVSSRASGCFSFQPLFRFSITWMSRRTLIWSSNIHLEGFRPGWISSRLNRRVTWCFLVRRNTSSNRHNFPTGKIPTPLCNLPADQTKQRFEHQMALWQKEVNHEASSAPLYYLVAAGWFLLGRCFGLEGVHVLYWIRFLNVFVIAALVWLGFVASRMVFQGRRWLWLGVPLLLAFFPQDAFYSIQSDVLSPLCFGAAFVCLVKWLPGVDAPDRRLSAMIGLTIAATGLTKSSNLPLLAVAFVFVLEKIWRLARAKSLRAAMPGLGLLTVCAVVPVGAWVVWNRYVFGDLTGSQVKIQFLGWTQKPFADWWHHPIFTPHGAWIFASELIASFWRGEFVWSLRRLACPTMDKFYLISSVLLPGSALVSLLRKSADQGSVRTSGAVAGFGKFRGGSCVFGFLVDRLRLWSMLLSFSRRSLLYFGAITLRRFDSFSAPLRVWIGPGPWTHKKQNNSDPGAQRRGPTDCNFRNRYQPSCLLQPI